MELSSDFPISPRATREATEAEIKAALQKSDRIAEWPLFGHTFVAWDEGSIILRLDGMMGGDTFPSVFYGWYYANPFSYAIDWNEIVSVPEMEPHVRRRLQG